jgi:hypothetical protein
MEEPEGYIGINYERKQAVIRETYQCCQRSGKKDKSNIPDELAHITGLNPKYLLHLLANWGKPTTSRLAANPFPPSFGLTCPFLNSGPLRSKKNSWS